MHVTYNIYTLSQTILLSQHDHQLH